MTKHRGEIVRKAIEASGMNVSEVAKGLEKTRATIYNWLNDPDLPPSNAVLIGKVIGFDFSKQIPEVRKYIDYASAGTPASGSLAEAITKLTNQVSELLEENRRLREQVAKSSSKATKRKI